MTSYLSLAYDNIDISTHTLTWSVTDSITQVDVRRLNFNSHAHVERDALGAGRLKHMVISTHTLTWSVTPSAADLRRAQAYFNSHAHVERDELLFL